MRYAAQHPGYASWYGMIQRCHNPKTPCYHRYGGRGITVCSRWRSSFKAFITDMGPKPGPKYSVDRYPNQNGNYEPGNCRWATQVDQSNNMRSNRLITYLGEQLTVSQVAELEGIDRKLLYRRLFELNMPLGQALEQPIQDYSQERLLTLHGKTQSLSAWAREAGINRKTLEDRLTIGIPLEDALKSGHLTQRTTKLITHDGRTQSENAWCKEIGIDAGTLIRRLAAGQTLAEIIELWKRKRDPYAS